MKSGNIMAVASLLGALVFVACDQARPRFDVPEGFSARVYASDIDGAREPALQLDGTLTLTGHTSGVSYEIAPATPDSPLTVMRVAAGLTPDAPLAERLGWHPPGGPPAEDPRPIQPLTLAAARAIGAKSGLDVTTTPDGQIYVTDARTGIVWLLSRESR